jgi:hypothetical protein
MDEKISNKENIRERRWTGLIIIVLVAAAAAAAWFVFAKDSNEQKTAPAPVPQSSKSASSSNNIDSLISYQLPDGWKTVSCSNPTQVVLLVPQGRVSPDCAALANNWPMKIMLDTQKTTECSQIHVNNQQVTNHICSSKFINGSKVFVSSTTYNDKSAYGKNTKVSDYYVSAKNNVVKLEYADDLTSQEDDYQAQFDQLANSITLK